MQGLSAPRNRWRALARGGRGIAQRVERVGALAYFPCPGHLSGHARIVGDRSVASVAGDASVEHADSGDADAIKAHRHILRGHHVLHIETNGAG